MDFDALTGADIIQVESEMMLQGRFTMFNDFAKIYYARMAAKAAKIPGILLDKLPARDFTRVAGAAQNFLQALDSSGESEKQQEDTPSTEPLDDSSGEQQ